MAAGGDRALRLEALTVEHFRKLKGTYTLEPAPAGLTVLSGDNEEGKSTILAALKAAFFLRHNASGAAREAIQPFDGAETPAVTVAFALDGAPYRLAKRFRRGGVRLETPEGALEGDAAELRLAALLQYEWPGRGAARDEQMGLAGLFWVDQGTTFAGTPRPSETARARLGPAIADQMAALGTSDRAQRLLARVRQRCESFWTSAQSRPRGALLELQQKVERGEAELERLRAAEREIEDRLRTLAAAGERRRHMIEADLAGQARRQLEGQRSTLARVTALEGDRRLARERLKASEGAAAQLRGARQTRHLLEADLVARRERCADLARQQQDLAPTADLAQRRLTELEAEEAQAQALLEITRAAREALARQHERRGFVERLARLDRLAGEVEASLSVEQAAAAAVAAEPLTDARLATLEEHAAEVWKLTASLRLVATRLELHPTADAARIELDGRPLEPAATLELTAPAELRVEGFGVLRVIPGGARLAELNLELEAAGRRLREALAAVGAADLQVARRRAASRRREAERARDAAGRMAGLLAGQDLADRTALDAERALLRARLASVPAADPAADSGEADDPETRRRALDAEHESLRRACETLGCAIAGARAKVGQTATALTRLEVETAATEREAERLEARLLDERRAMADGELEERLRDAETERRRAADRLARIEDDLARADPDATRLAVEQSERRVAHLDQEAAALQQRVRDLEMELHGLGAKGIGDERAAVEDRLELDRRNLARLQDEALAWRRLQETLESIDTDRQNALVEPLRARLNPYLQTLMGAAGAVFDAGDLGLTGLDRDGHSEPFSSLSIGAREQLAVLVRLAIGDLLVEKLGQSPPLILDDALVYADAVRLGRMRTILQQAAARQQILILTCRREDYLGLDARYLRLEDCRV